MSAAEAKKDTSLLSELKAAAARLLHSSANDMGMPDPEPIWGEPLFGVASGADPLWNEFKETAVGIRHWTPLEAFLLAYPEETDVRPEDLSVLVWVLPQTQATIEANRRETFQPSERWIRSRWFGETEINAPLRRLMLEESHNRGIQAVVASLLPEFASGADTWSAFGQASYFSERHAAYAAGLGTFGLSDGLITRAGKAHRLGCIILRAQLEPTVRPYTSHLEYCLFFKDGSCGMCVKRCPAGSLSMEGAAGRDKEACLRHLRQTTMPYIKETWGWTDFYGCGLCQTRVPCESKIPGQAAAAR